LAELQSADLHATPDLLAKPMSKRSCSSSDADGDPDSSAKRRKVKVSTFQKWVRDYDRLYKTATWLDSESSWQSGEKVVEKLKCKVCAKYKERIISRKNFSGKWIDGADSVRTTNVIDHAKSDQHVHAMKLQNMDEAQRIGKDTTAFMPIVQSLETLSEEEHKKLRMKFNTAYFVAVEQMAYQKYPKICELQLKHGVNLGTSYLNENSAKEFVHYIAESKRQSILSSVQKAVFYSILMDGSTDSSNTENEMLFVMWCEVNDKDHTIYSRMTYLSMYTPLHTNAEGLFESLQQGLHCFGISHVTQECCSGLVGIATDGASSNIANNGLRGLVEEKLPWIVWMWCLAHRTELAISNALSSTTCFQLIDEMLLRLYYLYQKSPKKCRELVNIIADLTEVYEITNQGGTRPIRACGTRWVCHKVSAMKRVIAKYGAYTAHLCTLSEDSSVKSADRCKFIGYLNKWTDAKYLLGCAVFVDVLLPCSIFSKSMQSDELDIVSALTYLLKTVKEIETLKKKPLSKWDTYATVVKKVSLANGKHVYQGQELKRYENATSYFENHYSEICQLVVENLRTRLQWSDMQLFRDIIFLLATQGWEKILKEDEVVNISEDDDVDDQSSLDAVDRLVNRFRIPLTSAGADITEVRQEFISMVEYSCQFISLSTMNYKSVWWRLFNCPSSSEWQNALLLAKLLFSLPASNGKLERAFSQVNLIKTTKRSSLCQKSLDNLVLLNVDKCPLKDFSSDTSIDLWWGAKQRRPSHGPRKHYKKRSSQQKVQCEGDSLTQPHSSASSSVVVIDDDDEVEYDADSDEDKEDEELDRYILDDWDDWVL